MPRYVYIWEFEVSADRRDAFVRHYGPNGTWAQLFRRAEGYIETLLLEDRQAPSRFLTVDRWVDSDAHAAFLEQHPLDYERLDRLCESLTDAERSLGAYWEAVGSGT